MQGQGNELSIKFLVSQNVAEDYLIRKCKSWIGPYKNINGLFVDCSHIRILII